jgi:hypothetical protein
MTLAYIVALIHYLDNAADAALARFRPVLDADEAGYQDLRYRLTTLPARPTLVASALGVAYAIATLVANAVANIQPMVNVASAALIVLDVASGMTFYVFVGVLAFHTIHQLVMVNRIYTRHTRINLFQRGPLYALSRVTAGTAIGIGIPMYLWFIFISWSEAARTTPDVILALFLGGVVFLTFVWPLLGAHALLEREKLQLQDEVSRRIEATIAALQRIADSGAHDQSGAIKNTLDGLVVQQGVIDKLPTWPWRAGTARGISAAFLLPIVIWVVQRVLERLGI